MYRHIYQYTHDIDWFFLAGKIPIHAASNGGLLPHNIYKISELQELQSNIQSMESICGFTLNKRMLNALYGERIEVTENKRLYIPESVHFDDDTPNWMKAYSWSFAMMAQRGFYSFDYCPKRNAYFLVARPNAVEPIQLPKNIKQLIYTIYDCSNLYSRIDYFNSYLGQKFFDFNKYINWYRLKRLCQNHQ